MQSQPDPKNPGNTRTILFMIVLSLICAVILASLASALSVPKEVAKDLDRSKQMMIAAKILAPEGYFQIQDEEGNDIPARYTKGGVLEPGAETDIATKEQLLEVYRVRFEPLLVNAKGDVETFGAAKIDETDYVNEFRKVGYYTQPRKLVYKILPNPKSKSSAPTNTEEKSEEKAIGYVIPVNGFGLWAAIYGYMAIQPDGNTVIGITWYDQQETPGLGANIAEPSWQNYFPGKHIFQAGSDGKTDYKTAPLGIIVVRGKVSDVLGNSPKAQSAVDGIAGSTLTGNGVTQAYQDVLTAYRPFLLKLHEQHEKQGTKTENKQS